MSNQLDTKAILAAAKAKMGKIETYKKYDLATKLEEYEEATEARAKADQVWREIRQDINGYLAFVGQPLLPDESSNIPQDDLITKLGEIMPESFPNGGNGTDIAKTIGQGATTGDISILYWTDGQTTLKKAKDANGKVFTGLKTRYLLATEADLDEINKAKESEKADREAKKKSKK